MASTGSILKRFLKDLNEGKSLEDLMRDYGLNREELDQIVKDFCKPEMMAMRDLAGRVDLTESQIGRAFVDLEEILNKRSRGS